MQIVDKLFFYSTDFYPFSLQIMVTIIMILVGLGGCYLFVKKIVQANSRINIRTLIILILATIIFLCINLSFNSFRAADEEWGSIYRAKTMLEGDKRVYSNDNTGIVFPITMAGLLKVSNFNYPLIRVFNIILGSLSLWLIFGCSQVLFGNDLSGLLSVLVYILTPWAYHYTGVLFGLPTLVHFLSLLSLLMILLAFKYHNFSLHLLALGALLILNQAKMEYFPYYLIYLILFCASKEWRKLSRRQVIIFFIVAIVLLIPAIVKANLFKISFLRNPGWCGFPSQTLDTTYINNSFVHWVNKLLQPLINTRISFGYFLGDLPVFLKFWSQTNLILPVVLAAIGIILSFKDYPYKKLQISLPIIFFGCLALGYCFDCGWYEARHAISAYGFLTIYAGYCLYWLLQISHLEQKKGFWPKGIIIYLLVVQLTICCLNVKNYKLNIQGFQDRFNTYATNKQLLKDFPYSNALFLTVDDWDRDILKCLGYRALSFNEAVDSNSKISNSQSAVDSFFQLPSLQNEPEVYFLKSFECDSNESLRSFCEALSNRSQGVMKEEYLPNECFKLQILTIKTDTVNKLGF